ncbi:hypothetical protein [Hamadaea tsunoensis]|uniref:hypothetical protein n=1 Tax=Hamadaea tsunoensis TaxID=53368 RepID=UPI0004827A58|nr:hypothetical protein [Hamadaea tsunoensis]
MTINGRVGVDQLVVGDLLDRGGQGEIWELSNSPDQVFKRYFLPNVNGPALEDLVRFPSGLPEHERSLLLNTTAWPECATIEGGRVVGFLMPRAPERFTAATITGGRRLRELQYLLYEPKPIWGDIQPADADDRIAIARLFVDLMAILHRHGVVLGDISMRNVLWCGGDEPAGIFVLDCDSSRRLTMPPVLPQANTTDWDDPAGKPGVADIESDRYKTALFVGRVLAREAYVRPGAELTLLSGIPDEIAATVVKTFAKAATADRTARPDIEEWRLALSGRGQIQLTPPQPRTPLPQLPMAEVDQRGARGYVTLRPLPRAGE